MIRPVHPPNPVQRTSHEMSIPSADQLITDRLLLRALTLEDADELFQIRGDEQAMAFWDWPRDSGREVTAVAVREMLHDVAMRRAHSWALRLRTDDAFVGTCDLSDLTVDSADLGFMLVRRYWGLGLAGEAVTRVLQYARDSGLSRIYARIHEGNARSARLLERIGFCQVEFMPDVEIRPGVFRNCLRYQKTL